MWGRLHTPPSRASLPRTGLQSYSVVQTEAHGPSEALLGNPPLCYLRFPGCQNILSYPKGLPSPRFQSRLEFRWRSWGAFPTPPAVPCSPVTPRHAGRAGPLRVPAQPPFGAN